MNTFTATPEACRKFLRRVLHLDAPHLATDAAIRHHGYIQIDPIDVCGKMHDLILRNRVQNYQRDDLLKALYQRKNRAFFEHYVGVLVALPIEDYRYLLPGMKARRTSDRYSGALDADQKKLARKIIDRIRAEGPLSSSAFLDSGSSQTGWGSTGTLAKVTLDKLFFHGRLLITRRDNFRRVFDLPERILPAAILESKPATPREIKRWLIQVRLRQRRLVTLNNAHAQLAKDFITKVKVADHAPVYCLKEDAELLQHAADLPEPSATPHLLAPLDPIIYDRKITRRLWDFDYTWEVYTPPAKRIRGYYALPILSGTRIIGHVDPKVDRENNLLNARIVVEKGVDLTGVMKDYTKFLAMNSHKVIK
ncbi:MAG: hypothetical protein K0Q55_3782 [Verrucomicrobia bacterium]|nr:hypothetical protein [Verrucomicrobiota bacterium]